MAGHGTCCPSRTPGGRRGAVIDPKQEPPNPRHGLFHRWFVEYNPLFFFSALCVLIGVFLVSRSLPDDVLENRHLLLAGIVQLYEFLLIGAAAALFHVAHQRRPAVILGLLTVPFLFDWTFQLESFAMLDEWGLVASFVWLALFPTKLLLLTWTFRLRVPAFMLTTLSVAVAAVAFLPHLMSRDVLEADTLHRIALWILAAFVAVLMRARPQVAFREAQGSWAQTVLRRSVRAACLTWAGLYLAHAGAWVAQFDLRPDLRHVVPLLLLLPFLARSEPLVWASAAGAVAVGYLYPLTAAPTAALVGLLFVLHAYHSKQARLHVGAILAFHLAAWTVGWQGGPLPEFVHALNLITAAVLLGLAWRVRLKVAVLAAALVLAPIAPLLIPVSTLGWGVAALAMGFVALLLGFLVNWREGTRARTQGRPVGPKPHP